jgi:hypothetical protein
MGAVAVAAPIGTIQALDNVVAGQSFQVLINGRVANRFALLIEAIVNLAGGEVLATLPQQLQDITALSAQTQIALPAPFQSSFQRIQGARHGKPQVIPSLR